MALEATLDSLDHGRPVPFTKVAEALQQPPHGHSKQAVDDLKVLLRRYLRQHSRPLRTDSTQRRYAPIAVSHRWMFVAAPHYLFRPATEEEQEQARAAEVERKLLADMPFRQRMRRLRQRRWTPPVKPKPITPSLRRAMKKALDSVKDTE
jgi:hypothetical protein